MKFTAILSFASLASAVVAIPAKRDQRPDTDCITAVHGISYLDFYGSTGLANACERAINGDGTTMWKQRICVAAAVATHDISTLNDLMTCADRSMPQKAAVPTLDASVYSSIVDCGSTTCRITQQNLIDLVYSELSAINSTTWPSSANDLITNRIQPIFTWTAFTVNQGIPFSNFNDWLHYGP